MMMPIALTDTQMSELMATGRHVRPALRAQYLQLVAALLQGRNDLSDADVWRAIHAAVSKMAEQDRKRRPTCHR
jgi:hypothetical protein